LFVYLLFILFMESLKTAVQIYVRMNI